MESPVLTLVVTLFVAVNVESQRDVVPLPPEFPLPPPRPPPSPLPESPPPRLTPPPSTPHSLLRPPPLTPLPPLRASFPPPRPLSQSPPPPRKQLQQAPPEYGDHGSYKKLSPPLETEKPNMGKKIGLMFIGVAAILQFCILAFLLIRRRQLLKSAHGY